MIIVNDITKSYPDICALRNVSLSVNRGSIYGLIGSNGAGKTTLLKILSGIYKQSSGSVLIDGQEIFENTELKERVIFIPDSLYFFPQHTVKSIARFYRQVYPNFSMERYEKIQEAFGIEPSRKINSLSKGMQRQVAFWLSLSLSPDVMILDEPLDGLDPVMRQKVKNLIIQDVAQREMTIIISSHNLRELEDICDHVGILHKGEIIMERDLDDLKSDIHKIQAAFQKNPGDSLKDEIDILFHEKRGSIDVIIARGEKSNVTQKLNEYNPVIMDMLPLTLEEIFIYEMGDIGYEIKNIIF